MSRRRRAIALILGATSACSAIDSQDTPRRAAAITRTPAARHAIVVAPRAKPSASTEAAPRSGKPRAWGPAIPGVIRRLRPSDQPRMALTLDACGGPGGEGYDAELIDLLKRERLAATLFLTALWIDAHAETAAALAAEPLFEVENHGARHVPCSVDGRAAFGIRGTTSASAARDEILGGRARIEALAGRTPRLFRPGTGYFDDVCLQLVREAGAVPVGFSVSGDGGAAYSRSKVRDTLVGAPDGAIVVMHMNRPHGATKDGLADALPALRERGVAFVRLSEGLTE